VRNYRLDSNPLWSSFSPYAPFPTPDSEADVIGGYGRLRLQLPAGFHGEGWGRVQSREEGEVPYAARWSLEGALHWRRPLFRNSMDLDASLGGEALGPRRTAEGALYPAVGTGYLRARARVDNGVLTLALENFLDAYVESDLRAADFITAFPAPGRTFYIGILFYLTQ